MNGLCTMLLFFVSVAPVIRKRIVSQSEPIIEDATADARELARRDFIACAVCYANVAKYVLLPCGHGKLCGSCVNHLADSKASCPFCRRPILDWLKVRDMLN